MPNVIFQPDLSMSIAMYNSGNDQFVGNRTIAEILEECQNLTDCDSIIIHKKTNYNGYSAVVPLKVNQLGSYHVGDNTLYDMSGKQVQLFEKATGVYAGYYYAYVNGVFSRVGSASMSETTINNITYYYDYDNRSDDYPPIMYISPQVVLYINNSHLIGGGGAGSGYIGNSLVSNKKMVGYNVPTSSAESTKTESVNEASESPVSGKPKIGNGYARIKLLREPVIKTIEELAKNADFIDHSKRSSLTQPGPAIPNSLSDLQEYYGTDWNLIAYLRSGYTYSNGVFSRTQDNGDWRYIVIPLKDTYTVTAISIDVKELDRTADWNGIQFWLGKYSGSGTPHFTDLEDGFIAAAKKPTAMGSTHNWFIEIPANSTDFNTLNAYMSRPVSGVNYIAFCTWAAEMQIKNIKLTVV